MTHLDTTGIDFQAEGIAISNALRLEHGCLVGRTTPESYQRKSKK